MVSLVSGKGRVGRPSIARLVMPVSSIAVVTQGVSMLTFGSQPHVFILDEVRRVIYLAICLLLQF